MTISYANILALGREAYWASDPETEGLAEEAYDQGPESEAWASCAEIIEDARAKAIGMVGETS